MKKKIDILVIEDFKHDYLVMERTLQRSDIECKIDWIQRGEKVIQKLKSSSFDIVLIDYKLPDEDGLEVFRKIKREGIDIPVVFITASGNELIAAEAIKSGAQDYIVKDPLGRYLDVLPSVIKKALSQWEAEQERKQAERALRESEERFRAIFETAQDSVFIKDRNLKYTLVNPAVEKLLGLPASKLIGKTDDDLFDKEAALHIKKMDLRVLKGNIIEEEHTKKIKGIPFTFHIIKVPLYKDSSEIIGLCGITRDITERKRAEKIQRALYDISNALDTVENLHELFIKIREYLGNVIDTTNFYVALYDEKTDMISLPFDVNEKDDFETFPAGKTLTSLVIKTGKPLFANRQLQDELNKQGKIDIIGTRSKIWLGVPLKVENKVIGVIAVQSYDDPHLYSEKDMDILEFVSGEIALAIERKRAGEALRKSEEKYRKQFEEALDAIVIADAETGILIDCNRAALELVGRKKSELVGKHRRILHPPEEIKGKLGRTFKQPLKEKEGQTLETQVITKKGEIKEVAIKANILELENKKVLQGIFRDITERKQAEEALRQSEENFKNIFQSVPESLLAVNKQIEVLKSNNAFAKLIIKYAPELNMSEDELKQIILSELRKQSRKTKHGIIEISAVAGRKSL